MTTLHREIAATWCKASWEDTPDLVAQRRDYIANALRCQVEREFLHGDVEYTTTAASSGGETLTIDSMYNQLRSLRAHPGSYAIIESDQLYETKTRSVRRSWRERLFTRPWRPWIATKTISYRVPSECIYVMDDKIVCHPSVAEALRHAISEV